MDGSTAYEGVTAFMGVPNTLIGQTVVLTVCGIFVLTAFFLFIGVLSRRW